MKPIKVLFVFPENGRRPYFPTAIGYLAAAILDVQEDAEIEVVDFNIERHYRKLMDESFDYIFVTGLSAHFHSIDDIIRFTKENNKHSEVVLGGIVVTSMPEKIIENTNADMYVIGEGERTIQEIVSGDSCDSIDGLAYRNAAGKIIINPKRELMSDIDIITFPAWQVFSSEYMKIYKETDELWDDALPILASRGCPMRCNFCYRNFEGTFRSRSIDNVLTEMELLKEQHKIGIITFLDEHFFANKAKILAFCEGIHERKLKIKWSCSIRVELADKELFDAMYDAGCYMLQVGIESGSQRMLDAMNKKSTVEANERFLNLARETKLYVGANVIIGYPGETQESINATAQLFHRAKLPAGFHLVQAFPGTPLWDYAVQQGYIEDEIEYLRSCSDSDRHLKINFTDMSTEYIMRENARLNQELPRLYAMNNGYDIITKINMQTRFYYKHLLMGDYNRIRTKLLSDASKVFGKFTRAN